MILAEKIIKLRKQHGWSQEELAAKLDVSRQSVSKWESMTSIPDLDKIIKLSQIFGVSTDYLIKDELEVEDTSPNTSSEETSNLTERNISLSEANAYMDTAVHSGKLIALGVSGCILSPVPLILMSATLTENLAAWLGSALLLLMIAAAVVLFIIHGSKLDKYDFLEEELISLEYGVAGIVEKKKEDFEPFYRSTIAIGVVLCIISVIPILISGVLKFSNLFSAICVCVLLFCISLGVYLFVRYGTQKESYSKLLEEGDYSREKKTKRDRNHTLSVVYWCSATALYLGISFLTMRWDRTWILWPVAGVLFSGVVAIADSMRYNKRSK